MWLKDVEDFAAHHGLSLEQARLLQVTAEHLHPRGEGGRNSYANIAAACLYCNRMRHQAGEVLSPTDYARYVQKQLRSGGWHGIRILPLDALPPSHRPLPLPPIISGIRS
jgi:CubicO group peptidase (beta-lactamase class C family)